MGRVRQSGSELGSDLADLGRSVLHPYMRGSANGCGKTVRRGRPINELHDGTILWLERESESEPGC